MGEDSSTGSNGGGSRRSRKKGGGGGQKPHQQPKPQKFTGDCEELKGHIFDVDSYSPSDNFTKTVEQLVNCIGGSTGHEFGAMVAQGVEKMMVPKFDDPVPPPDYGTPDADKAKSFKWETQMKSTDAKNEMLKQELNRTFF